MISPNSQSDQNSPVLKDSPVCLQPCVLGAEDISSSPEAQKLSSKFQTKDARIEVPEKPDEGSYQPLAQEAGHTMVGLFCPKCHTMCRGVAALKAHMAVCPEQQFQCEVCDATFQYQRVLDVHMKMDHYWPVGQVASAQRERTRGMMNKQPGVHILFYG